MILFFREYNSGSLYIGYLTKTLIGLLHRREIFHYAHFLQQINNAFSSSSLSAQAALQNLLLQSGAAPAEVISQGKGLLALWIHRQASVSAFGDAFVLAALLITLGAVPALLICKVRKEALAQPVGPLE